MYDPKTKKYPYPEDTAGHYIKIRKDDGTVFDRNYRYVDDSALMNFRQGLIRAVIAVIVFPVLRIRTGLRVHGREVLKKHKEEIAGGVISCSNHIHFWDYLAVMRALFPRKTNVIVWDKNVRGENGPLIRLVGGIPVPEKDAHATAQMMRQVGELLSDGWLHVYCEGSMWEFYQPIRPFKTGAAYMAVKYDKPIVPLAFSYREPGFIRKKIFRQTALLDLSIGEPLYKDPSLRKDAQISDLTVRCHRAVCSLAGIDPDKNIYPPLYNDSKRVDYY